MDRDEFMELVYETFAEEPDNVLANGIIEAADAYVEYEKAQLTKEDTTKDTTSDTISRQAALDIFDDYNISVENGELEAYSRDRKRLCDLPPIQPETPCYLGSPCEYQNPDVVISQPEPKEGHWIRTDCGLDVECKCSKCGYKDFVEPRDEYWFKRNYCQNCGSKMTISTK